MKARPTGGTTAPAARPPAVATVHVAVAEKPTGERNAPTSAHFQARSPRPTGGTKPVLTRPPSRPTGGTMGPGTPVSVAITRAHWIEWKLDGKSRFPRLRWWKDREAGRKGSRYLGAKHRDRLQTIKRAGVRLTIQHVKQENQS